MVKVLTAKAKSSFRVSEISEPDMREVGIPYEAPLPLRPRPLTQTILAPAVGTSLIKALEKGFEVSDWLYNTAELGLSLGTGKRNPLKPTPSG